MSDYMTHAILSLPQQEKQKRGPEIGKKRREMEHPLGPINISGLIRERVSEGWPFFLKLSVPPAGQSESNCSGLLKLLPLVLKSGSLQVGMVCCNIASEALGDSGWQKSQPWKPFHNFLDLSIFFDIELFWWLTSRVIFLTAYDFLLIIHTRFAG